MSLFSKIKKGLKKVGKAVVAVNPALGGGFSKINQMQGQALMGMGGGMVSMPGGGNPLASIAGMLGEKVGIGSAMGSALASQFLPGLGSSTTTPMEDLRSYAAWKIAPDSLLQNLSFDANGNPLKKRRRMNPLNARAAKRAIRRIKAVRKITAGIERALPKAKARAWHGHHHHRR